MSTFSTEKYVVDGAPMIHVAQSQSKFKSIPSRLVIMWEMEMREMISEKKIHISGEVRRANPTSNLSCCTSEESGIEWNGDTYRRGKTNIDIAQVRAKRWKERGREKGESVKRSNKDNRSRRNKEHERQRGGNKGRRTGDSRNRDERSSEKESNDDK